MTASAPQTSLGKALNLLFAVGKNDGPSGVSVQTLLREMDVSRPTAYRLLKELEQFGLVRPVAGQSTWRLGPKIVALAAQAGSWSVLRRRAKIAMDDFVQNGGPTVHMAIRDGLEVVYIDKSESLKHATIISAVGQRRPLNVTALGKCLVAFDPNPELCDRVADNGLLGRTPNSIVSRQEWVREVETCRSSGVAYDIEECEVGASCVAAPICDAQGHVVAAISISALSMRRDSDDFVRLEQKIRSIAHNIVSN